MPRPTHYSPAIERFLVSVLYHEARQRNIPMTRLTNQILRKELAASVGWHLALQSLPSPANQPAACQGNDQPHVLADPSPGLHLNPKETI